MKAFPAPAPGDIVWCRFPQVGGLGPGPKPRPALILAVQDDVAPVRVRVAYATSVDEVEPWEFRIAPEDGPAFAASGLAFPTKFSMLKVVVLDYTDHWFAFSPGRPPRQSPRLGVLHPSLLPRARAAYEATVEALSIRERLSAVYAVRPALVDELVRELRA